MHLLRRTTEGCGAPGWKYQRGQQPHDDRVHAAAAYSSDVRKVQDAAGRGA
jgi:hypothetical protein